MVDAGIVFGAMDIRIKTVYHELGSQGIYKTEVSGFFERVLFSFGISKDVNSKRKEQTSKTLVTRVLVKDDHSRYSWVG